MFEDDGWTEMAVLAEVIRDARAYDSTTDDDDGTACFLHEARPRA